MSRGWRDQRIAAAALAAVLLPAPALAHSTIEGIDAVYGGFLHPYFVPQHLLALIALALLVGVMKWRAAAIALPAYLLALVLGLGLGAAGLPPPEPLIALLALAMLCGAGAAAGLPSLPALAAIAGVLIGLTVGLDSVPESGVRFDVLAATAVGAAIPPVWLGCLLIRFRRPWLRLATRILGAWVVAASAMVLALTLTA
ncbi:HupE/UreJ family protein [Minwuia thermotolerans]|uniref:HupE/UreJ family protein n=1 Tax=Minwuia thermotolerans TaxID=2056226 RepID=UPI0013DE6DFB|nr:HupE/UreJ family protein [Minwuia thermotolerans]